MCWLMSKELCGLEKPENHLANEEVHDELLEQEDLLKPKVLRTSRASSWSSWAG